MKRLDKQLNKHDLLATIVPRKRHQLCVRKHHFLLFAALHDLIARHYRLFPSRYNIVITHNHSFKETYHFSEV